jgi:hypothetical protein
VGFGVIISSVPASAAPVSRSIHITTTVQLRAQVVHSGVHTAADWWW